MPNPAQYSLVSWVRRGMASLVSGQPATNYASLPVSIAVNGTAVNGPPVRLMGPGDITGLDARAVIRTDPQNNADAFEPNYLAMAELALPDLPWMFSPSGVVNGRLQPWICLIVVPDAPGATLEVQGGGQTVLRLDTPLDPKAELPDLKTIDFWAHAQVTGAALSGTALNTTLDNDQSGATLSRLIASRQLAANQSYIACIVPAWHAGVNAALGLPVDDNDVAPAWDTSITAPFVLPVYYYFRFQTGPGGDFASLAEQIKPPAAKLDAGTRPMDVSAPGFGAAPVPGLTMQLEGALRTYDPQTPTAPPPPPSAAQTAYALELRNSLVPAAPDPSSTLGPVLAPPTYGSSEAGVPLPADGKPPLWLSDLNLDPRTRVAASAGTQVVQNNQDALVAACWDQAGSITDANRLLRQGQLARQVSVSLSTRHLQTVPGDGVFLQIAAPMQSRVTLTTANTTLRGDIESSLLPTAAVSGAMRKLTRPRGPIGRQVAAVPPRLAERLNIAPGTAKNALVVAGPLLPPRGMIALDEVMPATPGAPASVGIQIANMTGASLSSAAGWKVAAAAAPVSVKLEEAAPATLISAAPVAAPISTAAPVTPAPPVKGPPLIDWSNNSNLPDILKVARPGLPAPLVFPSTTDDLAAMQAQFRTAATAVSQYLQVSSPAEAVPPPLGGTAPPAPGASSLTSTRTQLQTRLDPEKTIPLRVGARIPLGTGSDPLQPVTTGPAFEQTPMYTALADLSPEWMLPGVSTIPINCATLLAPNPQFVESFMVGLNEELSRVLLWNQVPADPQATYFQYFWGASTVDIPPIRTFDPNGHIGSHVTDRGSGSSIVLLVRANLFRRYPNAVVSAIQAQWSGQVRTLTANRSYPTFRGEIGSDITFFGFEIDDPRGSPDPAAKSPGWYFVIEEHLTAPRFGLEPATAAEQSNPPDWNDLSWQDLAPGTFPDPASPPKTAPQRQDVTWGQDAASMAFILMRKPVRVAFHALALLGPQDSGTGSS